MPPTAHEQTVVTVLHPGAMGAAVARQAMLGGATVRWVSAGRSSPTRKRASDAGLQEYGELSAALDGADVVLSICPPAHAEEVARALPGYAGIYVEANAIAPSRTRHIATLLPRARVVDGGIIGEPPSQAGTTRLYLSGPAEGVPELFTGTALEVVTLDGGIGQASALKMAYASYQKISRALAAVAHVLAREYGVDEQLAHEAQLLRSFPLAETGQLPGVAAKAWRWAPEMREIAATLDAAGLPDELALGAAAVFERLAAAKDDQLGIDAVLDMLRARRQ
ncbi:NAD(P)-dependent oxidoreductase [Mycolicibacterium sp. CH28]|uniref:NAD(P)-dependent oxidoreductase n=1 Tax=Mycolicibacterium sp. CH28 TaxID=2512237 RepID=UPI001080BD11|nr:NAD(P)-dependent oxidoreductase [Mycolicibacterium sp. CH28]TGD86047.1 NAD(P)-dependent oxidoreductase [Mycolicibacterium sp. CH28]